MQQQLAVILVSLAQKAAKLAQIPRILAGIAPSGFVRRLPLEQSWHLRRFVAIVEELIEWDLECTRQLFQRFNGGDSMTIFHAGDIAPEQASTLLDVTLGEFLVFAEHAKAVAYNHAGIISLRRMEGKQGNFYVPLSPCGNHPSFLFFGDDLEDS
jgi:hypothetical protein